MAADIGADMDRSEFALCELDRGKNRALRTAGAEIRRPRRNIVERCKRAGATRNDFFDAARNGSASTPAGCAANTKAEMPRSSTSDV